MAIKCRIIWVFVIYADGFNALSKIHAGFCFISMFKYSLRFMVPPFVAPVSRGFSSYLL